MAQWVREVEPLAYGFLRLTPQELGEMSPRDFEQVVKYRKRQERRDDSRRAFFVCLMTNVHLPRRSQMQPADIMKTLYPKTAVDREREAMEFLKEYNEAAQAAAERSGDDGANADNG